jgi:Protein of unknwon function (DUF3310)
MSLVGTMWKSKMHDIRVEVTVDEDNWIGIKEDDTENVHYMQRDRLVRKYDQMDMVNHPPHYLGNGSGVECIDVTEHMSFVLGNALKYIWRYENRGKSFLDLRKAKWYLRHALDNGHAATPPFKARELLNDVIKHEPMGLRRSLLLNICDGNLLMAIQSIDSELAR